MKKPLFFILFFPFLIMGCGGLDPVARSVNSPKQFEATYSVTTKSQIGLNGTETIELKTKNNKFSATYYEHSQLNQKVIYDGKTLWLYFAKKSRYDKDYAVYKKASYWSIKDKLYFWRLPSYVKLPKPIEETLEGKPYYVYKYRDYGPSGYVDVAIYVDKEKFIIKKVISNFFLKTDETTPLTSWDFECKSIVFRENIPDSAFTFQPPAGTEVKTFEEASREGIEALKALLSGRFMKR